MKKTVQLIKSGHKTHDIIIDLVKTELIKRDYNILMGYGHEPKSLKWDDSIYFTYFVINSPKFSKKKRYHPDIYGMHGSSLMKNAVSAGYSQFDAACFHTKNWILYWDNIFHFSKKPTPKLLMTDGTPKFDLFYNVKADKNQVCKQYKLNPSLPVILYAPTYGTQPWGKHFGSEYLANNIFKEIRKLKVNLLYLTHPIVEDSEIQRKFRDEYTLKFINIADKSKLFKISDLLISDTSGVISDYMIFDKPIIRIKKGSKYYEKNDFNLFKGGRLLDIGPIIDPVDLVKTINYVLNNDDFKDRRKYWFDNWLGKSDGHCTKREVDCMVKFAKSWWVNNG